MSFYRVYRYPLATQQAYKHIYFYGKRPCGQREKKPSDVSIEEVCKLENNLSRAKRTVKDLMLCNKFDYFCTFTFDGGKVDRYNFADCRKKLLNAFANYKKRYSSDFQYIVIPEFHADGAVHFHGVVRGIRDCDFYVPAYIKKRLDNGELVEVPNTPGYVDWYYYSTRFGHFSCSKINHYERCASYITKYITKDLMLLPKGVHAFMNSTGLCRPELIFDNDDVPARFKPQFKGDYCELARLTEDETVKMGILTPWWSDGDNKTIIEDDVTENGISAEPVTYEQLRVRDVIRVERVQQPQTFKTATQ